MFSFLIPTRDNVALLERFFESIVATTSDLDSLEVILAIDEDDQNSWDITHPNIHLKKVIMPPGSTMGALNRACFEASTGRFVMLLNDDVVLRTKSWDRHVVEALSRFPDDIALIHVNDLLFRDKLCTFPLLSRKACEAIGVCHEAYERYRIDDEIYDAYNLLALLGHKRIVYMPDVIFEHLNHSSDPDAMATHMFQSLDGKKYRPNQQIINKDAELFEKRFQNRKEHAIQLARLIDEEETATRADRKNNAYVTLLNTATNSFGYRQKRWINVVKTNRKNNDVRVHPRVTILVATADIRHKYARKCLASIKKHTSNYELVVMDNVATRDFSHPRTINRFLQNAETDFAVLMDDDVFVEQGWLDGLFASLNDDVAVVAPMHKDGDGKPSFSGCYLTGDDKGGHEHLVDIPSSSRVMQCYCSALLLLDLRKCGHILADEAYDKYFFDIDHGLRVWEAGWKAVCTPNVTVTHLGGVTISGNHQNSVLQWAKDRDTFVEKWVKSERLTRLETTNWQDDPFISSLVKTSNKIRDIFSDSSNRGFSRVQQEFDRLFRELRPHNLFHPALAQRLLDYLLKLHNSGPSRHFSWGIELFLKLDLLPDFRMFLIQEAARRGNLKFAKDILTTYLKKYPQSHPCAVLLAGVLLRMGDINGAESILQTNPDHVTDNKDTDRIRGKLHFLRGRYESARKCFTSFSGCRRIDEETAFIAAQAAHLSGKHDEARRLVRKGLATNPLNPQLLYLSSCFNGDTETSGRDARRYREAFSASPVITRALDTVAASSRDIVICGLGQNGVSLLQSLRFFKLVRSNRIIYGWDDFKTPEAIRAMQVIPLDPTKLDKFPENRAFFLTPINSRPILKKLMGLTLRHMRSLDRHKLVIGGLGKNGLGMIEVLKECMEKTEPSISISGWDDGWTFENISRLGLEPCSPKGWNAWPHDTFVILTPINSQKMRETLIGCGGRPEVDFLDNIICASRSVTA